MKDKIIQELTGKKVLILGFGREGRSSYNFIKNNNVNCELAISDMNEIKDEDILNSNVKVFFGDNYLEAMKDYDIILKTPGISFKDIDITEVKDKITSQTEFFIKYGREKIIGVTGTKGKSTTSSLIYQMLKTKYNVFLVGNIGLPAFDEMKEYDNVDYYIYELSSHQLEFVKHSPKYAILLNMFEEHLDHYKDYEGYKEAKRKIFKFQTNEDYYIYNEDQKEELNNDCILKQNQIKVSKQAIDSDNYCTYNDEKISGRINNKIFDIRIPENNINGKHNIFNIAVSVSISKLLGVDDDSVITAIKEFKTLPHRLENIGTYEGVTYIDDSISTIPEAVISAVSSIDNIDTVLIGGLDRGINYEKLIDYIAEGNINNVILMYDSGKRIYDSLSKRQCKCNAIYAENLEKGAELATKITEKNKICLLSPAAASYGYFKNFEERGDKFKEYILLFTKQ